MAKKKVTQLPQWRIVWQQGNLTGVQFIRAETEFEAHRAFLHEHARDFTPPEILLVRLEE